MRTLYRVLPSLSALLVASASFALSYVALRDVASEVEAVPPHLAFLVPVVIDGGVICGSVVIWANAQRGGRKELFPFFIVAALVVMSVVVNTAHAGPAPLAKVIAALPPLVLLATLELVASQQRRAAEDVAAAAAESEQLGALTEQVAALQSELSAATARAEQAEAAAVAAAATPATASKAPARKAAAKKTPAKKAPARKAPARKAPAKKAASKGEALASGSGPAEPGAASGQLEPSPEDLARWEAELAADATAADATAEDSPAAALAARGTRRSLRVAAIPAAT